MLEDRMLPLSLTGRIAYDHIEKKVITPEVSSKAYLELVKDVTNRTYKPNGSGPELFFKAMKRDQMNM